MVNWTKIWDKLDTIFTTAVILFVWGLAICAVVWFFITFIACTKPDDPDCYCGPITDKWITPADKNGYEWTHIVWQASCSLNLDTINTPLDMSEWEVGQVVCELKEIELDSCKI